MVVVVWDELVLSGLFGGDERSLVVERQGLPYEAVHPKQLRKHVNATRLRNSIRRFRVSKGIPESKAASFMRPILALQHCTRAMRLSVRGET